MTDRLEIKPLVLPDSLDSTDAQQFLAHTALIDQVVMSERGNADLLTPNSVRLVLWKPSDYRKLVQFTGYVDGEPVGYCWANLTLKEDLDRAYVFAGVLAEHRRKGYGTALLQTAIEAALAHQRTKLNSSTSHLPAEIAGLNPGDPDTVQSASGNGVLSTVSASTAFAVKNGFQLSMVERYSQLDLPLDDDFLSKSIADAAAKAGEEYQLVSWYDRGPEELTESLMRAYTQMSIDIPSSDINWESEVWDLERLRKEEEKLIEADAHNYATAVVHQPTGEVAGYTFIRHTAGRAEVGVQKDTFVHGAHRGHGLGLWMKLHNLKWFQKETPQAQRVVTWNAQENSHMLNINVGMGFRPAGFDGEWQRLDTPEND